MLLYREMKPAMLRLVRELEGLAAALDICTDQDAERRLQADYNRTAVRLTALEHDYWAASLDRGWPDASMRRIMAAPRRHTALTI